MNRTLYSRDLKPAFWQFMQRNEGNEYAACLRDFLVGLLKENNNNVASVVLFGGLARDKKPISGWSDIDLLVVFRKILMRNSERLAKLVDCTEAEYGIRIDLTQIDEKMLSDPLWLANCYNSEILNVLAMRANVCEVFYGTLPRVCMCPEQEKMAARFYISHTIMSFREYLIEHAYRESNQEHYVRSLARVTRWVFSIIRASLRLFDIYVHPYNPSLEKVKLIFPEIDLSVPYSLLAMRREPTMISTDYGLFVLVEGFLQEYVTHVLREATENQSRKLEVQSCSQ